MRLMSRCIASAVLAFGVLSLTPMHAQEAGSKPEAAPAASAGQSAQPATSEQQPAGEATAHPENPNAAVGQELAKESNAAKEGPEAKEEQGENEGLKHSTAVKWMAKTFGISIDAAYWIAMGINFAIIFLAIAWAMTKNLPGVFRARNEAIQRGLAEARAASEDAQRRLADIETRLSRLDAEVADIRANSEKESAAEEARVREAAEADVKRVLESAENEIDAAGRQARRDLKALAANLAVDLAARKLQIDQETDENLVRTFVSQLGKDGK